MEKDPVEIDSYQIQSEDLEIKEFLRISFEMITLDNKSIDSNINQIITTNTISNNNQEENNTIVTNQEDKFKATNIKEISDENNIQEMKNDSNDDGLSNWTKLKLKCINVKDKIIYNTIDFNSFRLEKNISSFDNFHLFNINYNLNKRKDYNTLQEEISHLIYFSYRKNFEIMTNNLGKQFTSDCGWGCMIRSAQMLLARAIFLLHQANSLPLNSIHFSIRHTLLFFFEQSVELNEITDAYFSMIKQYITYYPFHPNQKLKRILPPFSIHNIVRFGKFVGKYAGDLFSDYDMARIFGMINKGFNVFEDLTIKSFQNELPYKELIESCFTTVNNMSESIEDENGKYYFNKNALFFVSIRLGICSIASDYYESIKDLFDCKQCVGIIGGKKLSAFYFIGYDKDNMFYLDPHYSQSKKNDCSNYETYLKKTLHKIKFDQLQTAMTIGFLIKNQTDYKELIQWINNHGKRKYPCLTLLKQSVNIQNLQITNDNDF